MCPFIKQIRAIQEAREKFVNPLLEVTYWWFYNKKPICQEEETMFQWDWAYSEV